MTIRRRCSIEGHATTTGGSCHHGPIHNTDAVVVDPVFELVGVEADEAADLDDGDAPLVGQPARVAKARAQSARHILQG
jgi:hypothetical protein